MMDFITTYFVSGKVIPGGVQVNLGYAMIVILLWIFSAILKRVILKRSRKTE